MTDTSRLPGRSDPGVDEAASEVRFVARETLPRDQIAKGRVSRATLASLATCIDAAFGVRGLASRLDPARTAIVEEQARASTGEA
jgi:hypothetical protein